MRVVDFDFDPNLMERFLDWPRLHYASDPSWLPDPGEAQFLTGRKSSVIFRNFLILEGDEVCGRITAMLNPRLHDETGTPFGQLGFFECVNDRTVARHLVKEAINWLQTEAPAIKTMLAPMNFDTWHSYRLKVKGFDQSLFFMEPHNHPYYPDLFASMEFVPISQYITKTVTNLSTLLEAWEQYYRDVITQGYSFRSFNYADKGAEMTLVYRLSISMFRDNLFFVEIPETEFKALYAQMPGKIDPDLFLFVLDPSGETVGFCFSIPDHRQPGTVNIKTFGVLPRVRNTGVGAALAWEAYHRFQSRGFARVNHCLMRAGNRADQFDRGLAEITREYALYTFPLQR